MNYFYQKISSPVGLLHLVSNNTALLSVSLDHDWLKQKKLYPKLLQKNIPVLAKAKKQLKEYFAGKRKNFDLPILLSGTEFQIKTWRVLQKIPYGKTISYSEQAARIKKPKAVRAIGRTNGLNPLCIILPCHRVIGKSGKLVGYSGGLHIKEFLLNLERK